MFDRLSEAGPQREQNTCVNEEGYHGQFALGTGS